MVCAGVFAPDSSLLEFAEIEAPHPEGTAVGHTLFDRCRTADRCPAALA